jgi:hypothetical protein
MAEFFRFLYLINPTKINTNPIILKTVFTCDLNNKDIKSNNNPVKLNFSDLFINLIPPNITLSKIIINFYTIM